MTANPEREYCRHGRRWYRCCDPEANVRDTDKPDDPVGEARGLAYGPDPDRPIQYGDRGLRIAMENLVALVERVAKERDAWHTEAMQIAETRDAAVRERDDDPVRPEHYPCCEHCRVTLGVGDGTGKLFVYGDYESIAAVRRIIAERDAAVREAKELREALESIAANTCRDKYQEAARVAHAALAGNERKPDPTRYAEWRKGGAGWKDSPK